LERYLPQKRMTETAGERHEEEKNKVERDLKYFLLEGIRLESYCSLIHIQTEMMLAQSFGRGCVI